MAEAPTSPWGRLLRRMRSGNPPERSRLDLPPAPQSRASTTGINVNDIPGPWGEHFRNLADEAIQKMEAHTLDMETEGPAEKVIAPGKKVAARHRGRGDYYRRFADTAIRQMEAGTAPWQSSSKTGERVLPRNAVTDRAYTGGNALYLAVCGQERGFTDNRWITMQQIKEAGGQPPKGPGERILVRQDRDGKKPICRTATVYNVEQVRGLKLERRPPRPDWLAHRGADAVLAASPVKIVEQRGGAYDARAYYSREDDRVVLPERKQFRSPEHYYSTALRNMAHASGHKRRMGRKTFKKIVAEFEIGPPSRELLRAEIATITVCDRLGVGYQPFADDALAVKDPTEDPDYTKAWIKALKKDPREMHRAASEGHRIAKHLIKPARESLRDIARDARIALDAEVPERWSPVHPLPVRTPPAPARQQPAMTPGR